MPVESSLTGVQADIRRSLLHGLRTGDATEQVGSSERKGKNQMTGKEAMQDVDVDDVRIRTGRGRQMQVDGTGRMDVRWETNPNVAR